MVIGASVIDIVGCCCYGLVVSSMLSVWASVVMGLSIVDISVGCRWLVAVGKENEKRVVHCLLLLMRSPSNGP